MSDLYECPTHRTAFHIKAEPCWPCYVEAMYGGTTKGVIHPLPVEHVFWTGLEKARRSWRPVEQEKPMASDLDTLRAFLRDVEQWPAEDRANLALVANSLQVVHPTIYATLMDQLRDAPLSVVLLYAEQALNVPAGHRQWFRLLVMDLQERAKAVSA